MLIRNPSDIQPSEITDRTIYLQRREFLKAAATAPFAVSVGGAGLLWSQQAQAGKKLEGYRKNAITLMDRPTPYKDLTGYNNFYEFGTDKADPAENAGRLKTRPWQVAVEGEIKRPKIFDIDELLKLAPLEERIYRLRCVEGWSVVIPWIGDSVDWLFLERADQACRAHGQR